MEILFICTGNICRSPMAEGLLRRMLAARAVKGVAIRSAGTHAMDGRPAEPHAVAAARELGADISAHNARSLDREMVAGADLILVMEPWQAELVGRVLPAAEHEDKVRLLAAYGDMSATTVDDPYGGPLDAHRACARLMQACLTAVVEQILDRQLSS